MIFDTIPRAEIRFPQHLSYKIMHNTDDKVTHCAYHEYFYQVLCKLAFVTHLFIIGDSNKHQQMFKWKKASHSSMKHNHQKRIFLLSIRQVIYCDYNHIIPSTQCTLYVHQIICKCRIQFNAGDRVINPVLVVTMLINVGNNIIWSYEWCYNIYFFIINWMYIANLITY